MYNMYFSRLTSRLMWDYSSRNDYLQRLSVCSSSCPSNSLSETVSLSLCLPVSLSISFSLSFFISVSVSLSLSVCLCLRLSLFSFVLLSLTLSLLMFDRDPSWSMLSPFGDVHLHECLSLGLLPELAIDELHLMLLCGFPVTLSN